MIPSGFYSSALFFSARPAEKQEQRQMFFFYKPESREPIVRALRRHGLGGYIPKLFQQSLSRRK